MIPEHRSVRQAYEEARRVEDRSGLRRAGALLVVDPRGKLTGIFTDGDLRRHLFEGDTHSVLDAPIHEVMTPGPRYLTDAARVRDAVHLVRERRLDELPVVNTEHRPIGLIDVQDLVALKVIEG